MANLLTKSPYPFKNVILYWTGSQEPPRPSQELWSRGGKMAAHGYRSGFVLQAVLASALVCPLHRLVTGSGAAV